MQALSQCDLYLSRMAGVVREAVSDTAGAAQAIAQNNQRWAHTWSIPLPGVVLFPIVVFAGCRPTNRC